MTGSYHCASSQLSKMFGNFPEEFPFFPFHPPHFLLLHGLNTHVHVCLEITRCLETVCTFMKQFIHLVLFPGPPAELGLKGQQAVALPACTGCPYPKFMWLQVDPIISSGQQFTQWPHSCLTSWPSAPMVLGWMWGNTGAHVGAIGIPKIRSLFQLSHLPGICGEGLAHIPPSETPWLRSKKHHIPMKHGTSANLKPCRELGLINWVLWHPDITIWLLEPTLVFLPSVLLRWVIYLPGQCLLRGPSRGLEAGIMDLAAVTFCHAHNHISPGDYWSSWCYLECIFLNISLKLLIFTLHS